MTFLLLLVFCLLLGLVVLARNLRHADGTLIFWLSDDDESNEPADSTSDVDAEIAQHQKRIAWLQSTGGSGTWTAWAALGFHRRRVGELQLLRRRLLEKARLWHLPVNDPQAVHLPHPRDRAHRGIQT